MKKSTKVQAVIECEKQTIRAKDSYIPLGVNVANFPSNWPELALDAKPIRLDKVVSKV